MFPITVRVKVPSINPLNGKNVYYVINKKTLQPTYPPLPSLNLLKNKFKNMAKRILKRGVITPNLFYDREMHFAFFPRQNDAWLNDYYKKQGQVDSKQIEQRLSFFNSPTLNNSAAIMLNFAGFKHSSGILCDYGAGTGWLAKAMQERTSLNVYAVDISVDAMIHLKEHSKNIRVLTLDEFFSSAKLKYDFLACTDTFEHLNDPLSALKKLHGKANDGASVFLSVPNFDSYFSRIYFGIHPYYAFPAHLNYFTGPSLKALAELAGFKVIKQSVVTLPWEVEYISKPYNKKLAPISGWPLGDILNNGKDGERLFILLKK